MAQHPQPPGELVDAGGYRVHLYCTGQGEPAVFVVGAGYSFDWILVQQEVAKFTRICTYDASGTAWSDPGPPLTCSARVEELHEIMPNGPKILVGLSIGGLVERLLAKRYPDGIAGIVIVDHAFLDVAPDKAPPFAGRADLDSPPVLLSAPSIDLTVEETSNFRNLPNESQALHRWADSLHPKLATVETAEDCIAQIGDAKLGGIPLAVVSTANDNPNYPKLQKQLLALSTYSRQFIADKSFHSIEIDQPGIVVEAIRLLTSTVRSRITGR